MKKLFIFFAAIFFAVALFGQRTYPISYRVPFPICTAVDEVQIFPSERPSQYIPQTKQGCWAIGETWFPSISNASARTTVSAHPDGDMVNVWTFLKDGVRGTGYNWHDKASNSWDPIPEERLEQLEIPDGGNPGFPSHAFTENGEIVVSHNAALKCLMVLTREKRGEGAWVQTEFTDKEFSWPCICTDGNTVHMIATISKPQGSTACVVPYYFRSPDGGKTWDIEAYEFPTMPESERAGNFADDYIIVSKGAHVVYAYVNLQGTPGHGNVGYMESFDGGDSWTHKPVYNSLYDDLATIEHTFVGRTVTAAIDDENHVHIAFSFVLVDDQYLYPGSNAIYYWKDHMSTLTYEDIEFEVIVEGDKKSFDFKYLDFPNVLTMVDILGFDYFDYSGEVSIWIDSHNKMGAICAPRIILDGNNVYLSYSSVLEEPIGIAPGDAPTFYRGVFLTVSDDKGDTFNQQENTSWLSYHKNLFYCDWSGYNGPVDPSNHEAGLDSIYAVQIMSDNNFPTMAIHLVKDQLLLQWASTYRAGVLETDSYDIYTMTLNKNLAGIYNNTQEIWRGKWNNINFGIKDITGGIEGMNIYPNPAQNRAIVCVNSTCIKPYILTVTNTMGQVILTEKGQLGYGENNIQLNVNNFASGLYLVNIKTDNATRTQKLIVR